MESKIGCGTQEVSGRGPIAFEIRTKEQKVCLINSQEEVVEIRELNSWGLNVEDSPLTEGIQELLAS